MTFVALDFETTGLDPKRHRVVEIGAVVFTPAGSIIQEFHTLVHPGGLITASSIHGITPTDLASAPEFGEILAEFSEVLTGRVLVAHNAAFDGAFLHRELVRAGVDIDEIHAFCTLDAVSRLRPSAPRRLARCCKSLGIEVLEAHHALNDARMTAQLAISLLQSNDQIDIPGPIRFTVPAKAVARSRPAVAREAVFLAASETGSFLSSLVSQLESKDGSSKPEGEIRYLEKLDEVLSDRDISLDEAHDLVAVAQQCGIDGGQILHLHRAYFTNLCDLARADQYVSAKERQDLKTVALLLGIEDWEDQVDKPTGLTVWKPGDPIGQRDAIPRVRDSDFAAIEAETDFSDPQVSGRLKGKRIVITGMFTDFSREQGKEAITRRGGKATDGLSNKTDALVAGEGAGPSKLEKASSMGVPILNSDQFRALLDKGTLP